MSFHDNLLSKKRLWTAVTTRAQQQISEDIELAKKFDIALPPASAQAGQDPTPTPTPEPGYDVRSGGAAQSGQIEALLPSEPPFSVRSLSERWGCSEGAVRSVIRNGGLRHFRVGDLIRVPADEVRRFECRR